MNLFVPGRVCILGEHSDWAAGFRTVNPDIERGYALVCGTDQGLHARVARCDGSLRVRATTRTGDAPRTVELAMERETLLGVAREGGFWSYLAGVAYCAMDEFGVGGVEIDNFATDLPVGKGLSSSAAVCVLAARAFNRLYDLGLDVRGEMDLAYRGETTTPSRCGRLDQCCAFGDAPVLATFDGDDLGVRQLEVGATFHFVVVDLAGKKDTVAILRALQTAYPSPADERHGDIHALLGATNRRIVHAATGALAAGDAATLGALMVEAQREFDRAAVPACPQELTAPALHRVLDHPSVAELAHGGKGMGSQGDGAAQILARGEQERREFIGLIERDLGMSAFALTLTRR